MTDRQRITVPYEYDVHFTHRVFHEENTTLRSVMPGTDNKTIFFVDSGVAEHWPSIESDIERWCDRYGDVVKRVAPVQIVPGGERIKNSLDILDRVGHLAKQYGICRHSYIVIVGGGAVLDAVGFSAATIHRGVRQIRVPTTMLSQDDSGVGVKNGLNRFNIKNFYGAYAPPVAVIIDTDFLKTLDDRDIFSGVAEAFKVAIIKDADFLNYLIDHASEVPERNVKTLEYIVRLSAALHLDHIRNGGDPFETGIGRPLDFGHWAAHRLESLSGYGLRHGEAVAVGIAMDLYCAWKMDLIGHADYLAVTDAMKCAGLTLWHDALDERTPDGELAVLAGLESFREHLGGELTLAMPDGLGKKTDIHSLPVQWIEEAVDALRHERTNS